MSLDQLGRASSHMLMHYLDDLSCVSIPFARFDVGCVKLQLSSYSLSTHTLAFTQCIPTCKAQIQSFFPLQIAHQIFLQLAHGQPWTWLSG